VQNSSHDFSQLNKKRNEAAVFTQTVKTIAKTEKGERQSK
jgi:hypothetical protein